MSANIQNQVETSLQALCISLTPRLPTLRALTCTAGHIWEFFDFLILSQVDYIPYCDEIANEVGCKPDLWWLLFRDPALALRCFFGPCTPAQYRLMGPGTWAGAKKAIEDAPGNVIYATKTRSLPQKEGRGSQTSAMYCKVLVLLVVVFAILLRLFLKTE